MDLGRGFPTPREKGIIQNGNIWIPSTPDKPVLQKSSNTQSEMSQNQIGEENWQDLLGIYTGVLQKDMANGLPQKLYCNSSTSPSPEDHNIQRIVQQNSSPTMVYEPHSKTQISQNVNNHIFNRAGRNVKHNIQYFSSLQKLASFNQNARSIGSYNGQNFGEAAYPQKVNSLAELMDISRLVHAPPSNGASNRSSGVIVRPTNICPHSQIESNQVAHASIGTKLRQSHFLNLNHDVDGCNLQEMTNGGLSVRNYNLNLPPAPEAGESSSVVVRPFPLGPVTPDRQKQSKSYQSTQVPQLSIDETSTQEKCIQNNAPQPESLLHTPSTSAAVISTSFREINNCGGGNEGIDLNQTPQQKPPKRKKHRPKVVNEGKRKRGPKPAGTKSDILDGNPKVKRKYVRKNGVKSSETPLLDNAINAVEASNGRPSKRSRKRKLNFDLENGAENERKERKEKGLNCQTQNNEGGKLPFNLNLDAHNAEVNGPPRFLENKNTCGRKIHHTENANNFVHSINKVTPQESLLLVNMSPSPPTPKDRTLNVIARILNMRNASANQITDVNRYNQVNHCITGGLGQHVIHANASLPNLYNKKQPAVPTIPQLVQDLVNVPEIQGAERLYTHIETRHPHTITLMGSQLLSNAVSEMGHSNRDSGSLLKKGINTGNKFYKTSSCLPSEVTTDEGFFRQNGSRNKNFDVQSYAMMQQSGVSANSDIRGQSMSTNPNDRSNNVPRDWYMNNPFCTHKLHQQHVSSQVHICSERVAPIPTSHAPVIEQGTSTLTVVTYQNLGSASQSGPKSIPLTDIRNTADPVSVTRRIAGQASSNKVPNVGKSLEHEAKKRRNYRNSSKEVTGSQEERMISIDYITNLLKDLHIYSDGQRAVVPYKGDGAVILYEEFDLVKRRRPRPRVDLDPETNRLWNLLMGKEGGESAETMDTDKQKWWEEERKVFQGRVDSFIARMHLVQGDRRFSKWKGSVVDSVIGVFLTQNVSDHLSSSAFMCLAAKFPLKSTTVCQPRGKNGGSSSVEHHEVRITYPDGTTYDHRIPEEPASNHSSVTSIESSEYRAENLIVEKRTLVVNNHTRNTEEDIISSQSSSESFVFQANEDVRSSSGSNSEAEDGWNLSKNLGSERFTASQQYQYQCKESSHPYKELLFGHQQLENSAPRQNQGLAASSNAYSFAFSSEVPYKQPSVLPFTNYWPNLSLGLEKWEADILAFSGKESISTLASTQFEITNGTYVKYAHDYIAQSSDSTSTSIQNGIPKFQPSAVNDSILNKHLELKTDFRDKSENRNGHHFVKHARGMQESPQQGNTSLTDPSRSAEAFSKLSSDMYRNASTSFNVQDSFDAQVNFVTDRRKHAGDTTHEPTERGQVISSNKHASHIGTATPNARKRKVEQEKTQPFDWDTLRKQVQSKDGTRERCRQRMDSLDYEALRNADVREISDTIKERGMNNMLAERMKSFLDRLVQDHERIDLEWLRDVEPDKAKDYLLSIRGLGLKSVECIRLLTLHHLAFPVDTNVGRIAVRLGWVPLQPLPESLQLHLLELYPVLESIQKYLWPRLCKLDQETLYELHYQMITFGKVFCTKREPNCNACPMRGECRHFASAFASARLALPGPEENRIVSSAAPVNANKGPDVIIKPTPLISSSDRNVDKSTRNCQPVIEEPTTPEPPEELSERDIEDAFYEDPDEIPVIKLDVQEFTTNLQSFMQKQMELGEADMSKALVALSPGLASIPVPKLKNISRLRTEHQVYELPDSHPLLKWMGRREPDDPSPYLLAIWTPGETADSVQPPESKCSSQEGSGLCNKETCFSCNSTREAQTQTVRGTILVPCRTAMRGSFPLNGTYFQVNEVFADHESSLNPIDVPRSFLWNLPRRTVFFGTSVSTIFKGLSTEGIQYCFWRGFVCVRGFDQKTRAPRPLRARLHFPASKIPKRNE